LPRADQETSRLHREYVRRVVAHSGKPPTRIAMDLGIAPSTLTRLLNAPEGSTATLHALTLRKLQDYSGIPPPFGGDPSASQGYRGFGEDAVPFDAKGADPAVSAALKALIGGRKAADPWTIRTRALERIGYLPGDIVIVDLGRRPATRSAPRSTTGAAPMPRRSCGSTSRPIWWPRASTRACAGPSSSTTSGSSSRAWSCRTGCGRARRLDDSRAGWGRGLRPLRDKPS
jgi:hypothetical protein